MTQKSIMIMLLIMTTAYIHITDHNIKHLSHRFYNNEAVVDQWLRWKTCIQ